MIAFQRKIASRSHSVKKLAIIPNKVRDTSRADTTNSGISFSKFFYMMCFRIRHILMLMGYIFLCQLFFKLTRLVWDISLIGMLNVFLKIIESELKRQNMTLASLSRKIYGNSYSLHDLRRGACPSLERAKKICDALGLEFYIGLPRKEDRDEWQRATYEAGRAVLRKLRSNERIHFTDKLSPEDVALLIRDTVPSYASDRQRRLQSMLTEPQTTKKEKP